MKTLGKEFLVGLLVTSVVVLMGIFAWLMGVVRPFTRELTYHVLYNFAGGVEIGAPVRVAGIKVGKVSSIDFIDSPGGTTDRTALRLTLLVNEKAASQIRRDSHFYINMAGIIGERYIEVSPGSLISEALPKESTVRGVDPPRIDQLLSQGYGVFGRVQEFMEQNERTISEFLDQLNRMMTDFNKILKGGERKKVVDFIDNLNGLTSDMRILAQQLNEPKAQEAFDKLYEMIRRAYNIDKDELKKFFQDEGIRARIF